MHLEDATGSGRVGGMANDARKAVAVFCTLKLQNGNETSMLVRVCETEAGAKQLIQGRTDELKQMLDGEVVIAGERTGMKVRQLLANLSIGGIDHRMYPVDVEDPSQIAQVTPRLVLM